ncbi:hypothetical protein N7474_003588 [Penicillium riverlandense]|uniref:uncharacterized protein n=1 Tax=Penicillium riverlandense TaxID=1903569 RepID=UPI0025495542|nr:uncharacterized protein N7474_003588 [Penicillium riverlandense]KAJ5826450.1 hypothetical protein N7474_003588 [Penicillium riverlandense]
MDSLQFGHRMFERVRRGERLTDEEIGVIANKSIELAGVEPRRERSTKPDQVLSKPVDEFSQQDAREVSSKESRAFANVPATGSLSSNVQSVAERND